MLAPPLPQSSPSSLWHPRHKYTNLTSSNSTKNITFLTSAATSSAKLNPNTENPPLLSSSPPPPKSSSPNNKNEKKKRSISKIQVPRQKFIPVSKTDLLDALTTMLRPRQRDDDEDVISNFLLISSCLDSILHAEHKKVLEEMRADYFSSHPTKNQDDVADAGMLHSVNGADKEGPESEISENGTVKFEDSQMDILTQLDLFQLLGSSLNDFQKNNNDDSDGSGVAAATRFQRSFMKLLQDAQFEELSVRDLMLTSALNPDYLLNLPINVDWKKASESNAIIFRRGYSTEKQKGMLIVEKLDYVQSKILLAIFRIISKPLVKIGLWLKEVIKTLSETEDVQVLVKRIQLWGKEVSLFRQSYSSEKQSSDSLSKSDPDSDGDLPIWLAAQKAVSRYEGFLSPIGPRGRLLRRFFSLLGLAPAIPEAPFEFELDIGAASEPHLRPASLSRITLGDIWRPATTEYCGNDIWKMLRMGFSIIFSQSVIQEPAFKELILLYTEGKEDAEKTGKVGFPSLQLKIYEKIPVPDLAVVFPHKRLSFRILDTVRLDAATIVGLLAYVINYKFEDVLLSPSAILLDVIAVSALIIYLIRVALGYKQTWDRYQLLVNRTLYEKTLASGFGSVYFLLDASEQQQFKECILAYGILLKVENNQFSSRKLLGEECEKLLYRTFKEKVQMPIDKAVDMLTRFGLVSESTLNGNYVLQVVPFTRAYNVLRERWDCLLG